jgi:hypothetical protein
VQESGGVEESGATSVGRRVGTGAATCENGRTVKDGRRVVLTSRRLLIVSKVIWNQHNV